MTRVSTVISKNPNDQAILIIPILAFFAILRHNHQLNQQKQVEKF